MRSLLILSAAVAVIAALRCYTHPHVVAVRHRNRKVLRFPEAISECAQDAICGVLRLSATARRMCTLECPVRNGCVGDMCCCDTDLCNRNVTAMLMRKRRDADAKESTSEPKEEIIAGHDDTASHLPDLQLNKETVGKIVLTDGMDDGSKAMPDIGSKPETETRVVETTETTTETPKPEIVTESTTEEKAEETTTEAPVTTTEKPKETDPVKEETTRKEETTTTTAAVAGQEEPKTEEPNASSKTAFIAALAFVLVMN